MIETFRNPGPEWRGKPFWSWNGKLQKDELIRQINIIKEMGMGGFFMHSRTGLETKYLGDEWFELINACADHAESIGLESWLYDEDRWPSGLAGGLVSKYPEYRQKAILMEIDPEGAGHQVLAEFKADIKGAICLNLGCGKQLLRFSVIEQGKSGFYNGYTYIDAMNPKATEAFLQCTHERYAKKCGDRLGNSIKGIFTDEPHRGALLDGFSMFMENGDMTVPYTQRLFDEFESRFGYELKPKLPELFLKVDNKRISSVKWHFVELLQQLFLENFALPCKEWCEKHNLILTGHVLHEDNLTAQTAMSGSVMRYYEHMSAPGIDVLGEENRNYWIVKQLASAARQLDKNQMLSELYGCTGWQMSFAGHKAVGDWQALLGINLRCHHLSWYTMGGEAKRDYPASILHQSAWFREYKHVEDYFARFGYMMTQGKAICEILVINPIESVWAQVSLGWSENLSLKDEAIRVLEEKYKALFLWLMETQVDFDYGDESMIGRLGRVVDGKLQIGCASYSTVLISGMETIRSSTLALLDEFAKVGGQVLIAGKEPTHVDAEPAAITSKRYRRIPFTRESLAGTLPSACARVEASDVFVQLREVKNGLIFAALSVNRNNRREGVRIRIKTDLKITEWDCASGELHAVDADLVEGWRVFNVDFPIGGQKLWVASNEEAESLTANPALSKRKEFNSLAEKSYKYTLSEPNICVLDFANYRIDKGEWQPLKEVLKIDQVLRDYHSLMHRGGRMVQPWFAAGKSIRKLCDLSLRFNLEIELLPEWMDLVIEDPKNLEVEINGHRLVLSEARTWIDIAFHRFSIPTDLLHVGTNEILLKTRYTEKSNIEAIYLLGEFGVKLKGIQRNITAIAEAVKVGDLCNQGFPFYSGTITYEVPLPEGKGRMYLPKVGGACVKIDGKVFGWDPFEAEVSDGKTEIEIILSRRNTFGPLHDAIKGRYWSNPDAWITEGDEFEPNPVLLPTGLLEAPMLKPANSTESFIFS